MSALMLSGSLMLIVGGFAVVFGAKPPYNQREQRYSSMIETARAAGKVLCIIGTILLVTGIAGFLLQG